MTDKQLQSFYQDHNWDVQAWVDVIAIEYRSLLDGYPFSRQFQSMAGKGPIRVLDVGCGTGIFPAFLDQTLSDPVQLSCDLLDRALPSLQRAAKTFASLSHFSVGNSYQMNIESIPARFASERSAYDVIWAMHSFTTVDIKRMPAVISRLCELLTPGGSFYIYQLSKRSSYEKLHSFYRQNYQPASDRKPFMHFEQTERIFQHLGVDTRVIGFEFEHQIHAADPDILQLYLRKCILDEHLNALEFFAPILPDFLDKETRMYRFPQRVNLAVIQAGRDAG